MSDTADEERRAADRLLAPNLLVVDEDAHRGTLTEPELDAIRCISHGLSDKMAAEVLGKSHYTVGKQVRSARSKLNAKTRAHLVAICYRQNLID